MSHKLAEFYRRAEEDPVFRDKKLKEERSHRRILPGVAFFVAALCVAEGISDGYRGQGWLNWNELVGLLYVVFGVLLRVHFTRRLAVLEAMNPREAGRAPESTRRAGE